MCENFVNELAETNINVLAWPEIRPTSKHDTYYCDVTFDKQRQPCNRAAPPV